MRTFIIAFLLSLLTSLLLTPRLRDFAIKLNWVDEVGGRKIHTQPIPRVGGIAVFGFYFDSICCHYIYGTMTYLEHFGAM